MKLVLLTGPDCHLCELAKEELALIADHRVMVTTQSIRDDANLYHLYAARIPVLKREDTDQELNWPFNHQDISNFIQ